jgi:hypothetical protein
VTAPEAGVALGVEAVALLYRLRSVSRTIAYWLDIKRDIRNQLLDALGTASYGEVDGQRVVTVIRSHPRRFNLGHFAVDHPGLAEAYREDGEEEIRLTLAKTFPDDVEGGDG